MLSWQTVLRGVRPWSAVLPVQRHARHRQRQPGHPQGRSRLPREDHVTGANKRKGDRAERQAAVIVGDLTGIDCRRLLGAGRQDDRGDLDLPGWTVQVADWNHLASALRQKPLDADLQAARSGTWPVAMLRLRGGDWRMVMTPATWALIAR